MNFTDFLSIVSPIVLIMLGIMMKYSVNDGWSSSKKWWPYFLIGGTLLLIVKLFTYESSQITEKNLYKSFYESSKQITNDEAQRKALANCFIESIKATNGNTLEGLNSERVDEIAKSIAADCAKSITKISWTQEMEQTIFMKVHSMEELDGASKEIKSKYARCIISKLKAKYPDGIKGQVPQGIMDTIYRNCLDVMK